MLNYDVINDIKWLFSIFDVKLISFISSLFAIYFAWQKLTTKVSVSIKMSASRLYDHHISSIVISNKRDKSITIDKIICQFKDKNNLDLKEFEFPLILKGYDTQRIDIDKYSYITHMGNKVDIEPFSDVKILILDISGNVIECTSEKHHIPDIHRRISKRIVKFNGIVLTSRMRYIFTYNIEGEIRNTIIDFGGFLDGDVPFQYNMIKDDIVDGIKYLLIEENYHSTFSDYKMFAIDNVLNCDLVFHKKDIEIEINAMNDQF